MAGNLNYRTNNTLIENFQVNSLNELTANTNGGKLTVMGTSTSPTTSVAVNGTNALLYGDATFAATNMPLTTTYTATASDSLGRHATNTVTVSIASSTAYQYDGNGNLTNDGLRSFAYDDENQLIQVWVANQWFSQFTYDGKMRRRMRQEYTWQGGAWVQTNKVYYVYDGNVVIQERDINNLPTTTYTRGKDLSGSLEGAGGIGGFLARTDYLPLATGQSFFHADGNGNVTMLINDSQAIVAKYLYDAFGNIISKSGLLADANLYRFSSKEAHPNSGLVYYLYRYYDPNLQRWLNRDPIGDRGSLVFTLGKMQLRNAGIPTYLKAIDISNDGVAGLNANLYEFVANAPASNADPTGLGLRWGWPPWGNRPPPPPPPPQPPSCPAPPTPPPPPPPPPPTPCGTWQNDLGKPDTLTEVLVADCGLCCQQKTTDALKNDPGWVTTYKWHHWKSACILACSASGGVAGPNFPTP